METAGEPAKAATRRSSATKAEASRAKASRTRAAGETQAALRDSQKAGENADVVGDYAERAVLIPVGAALIARDRVVSSVSNTISIYSSPTKTQPSCASSAYAGESRPPPNAYKREVRRTRVRVERELRQRRKKAERTVNDAVRDVEKRRGAIANGNKITDGVPIANQVQERIPEPGLGNHLPRPVRRGPPQGRFTA